MIWTLLTGGCCSEVTFTKINNRAQKWWSLYTSGRYSEVVVNSGLLYVTNHADVVQFSHLKIIWKIMSGLCSNVSLKEEPLHYFNTIAKSLK